MVETLGSAALATERTTLECWCGDHDCPESFVETVSTLCAGDSSSSSLAMGCGMIAVRHVNLSGSERVFDATSGALIGIAQYADTITSPCRVSNTFAGVEFDCPGALECPACDGNEPRLEGCE
jgi:hypothetical protein